MDFTELDYELYKLLDENGFEPTEENLEILKEGLSTGEFDILDSSNVVFNEGMSQDFLYKQILENNGFEIDDESISALEEGIVNGEILLTEGVFKKWRNKIRARKRMKKMWAEGKLGKHKEEEQKAESSEEEKKDTEDHADEPRNN